jgi:hypothetical protein
MLTGHKDASRVAARDAITASRTMLAVAIVATLALVLALAIGAAPEAAVALF